MEHYIKSCLPSQKDEEFMSILRQNQIPCNASAILDPRGDYDCIIQVSKENFERAYRLKEEYGGKSRIVIVNETKWLR